MSQNLKNQRILLLGATGQLGSRLVESLKGLDGPEKLICPTRQEFDLSRPELLEPILNSISPTLLVNAAAYTQVDQAEQGPDHAFRINRDSVAVLANWCTKAHAKLVHFSTDYVFDGEKGDFYHEKDRPNPINIYGRSKYEGEMAILDANSKATIIRTSCLYDVRGQNFQTRLLKQITNGAKEIKVVTDVIGSPTFAPDLAKKIYNFMIGGWPDAQTLHLAGPQALSRYDWAKKILDNHNLTCYLIPVLQDAFPTPAKRPKNTSLSSLVAK